MEEAYVKFKALREQVLSREVDVFSAVKSFNQIKAKVSRHARRNFQECFSNAVISVRLGIEHHLHYLGEKSLYDSALDLRSIGETGFLPIQFKSTTVLTSTFKMQNKYPGSLVVFGFLTSKKVLCFVYPGSLMMQLTTKAEMDYLESKEELFQSIKKWMPFFQIKQTAKECLHIQGHENIDGDTAEEQIVELLNFGSNRPFHRSIVNQLPFDIISGTKSVQVKSVWTYHDEQFVSVNIQRCLTNGSQPYDITSAPKFFLVVLMCPLKRKVLTMFFFRRTELARLGVIRVDEPQDVDGVHLETTKGRTAMMLPITNRRTFLRGFFSRNFLDIEYDEDGIVTDETKKRLAALEICGAKEYVPRWLKQQVDAMSIFPGFVKSFPWQKQMVMIVLHAGFELEQRGLHLLISQQGEVDLQWDNGRKKVAWVITYIDVDNNKFVDFSSKFKNGFTLNYDEGAVVLWSSLQRTTVGVLRVPKENVEQGRVEIPWPIPSNVSNRALLF